MIGICLSILSGPESNKADYCRKRSHWSGLEAAWQSGIESFRGFKKKSSVPDFQACRGPPGCQSPSSRVPAIFSPGSLHTPCTGGKQGPKTRVI